MFNFPCQFREGATPQSGIDTIQMWIHPEIVKSPWVFHKDGSNNAFVNLRYKREVAYQTGEPIRTNFRVDIQAEAINPSADIYETIIDILTKLAQDGVLHFPASENFYGVRTFFKINFDRLFALEKLDFYHDFYDGDIIPLGSPRSNCSNTRYSHGSFKRLSVLKIYDRRERLRAKRNMSHEAIDNINFPLRVEFALRRGNCQYMNILNLMGSYEDIFSRYLPFLSRKWHDHRHETVDVRDSSYAPYLRRIMKTAGQRIPHYGDLQGTPPKPIPYKNAGKDDIDRNWISEFYASL
jgi:hypothetical protein